MLSCNPRNDAPGMSAMYGTRSRRSISAATSDPHSGEAGRAETIVGTSRRLIAAATLWEARPRRRYRLSTPRSAALFTNDSSIIVLTSTDFTAAFDAASVSCAAAKSSAFG